MKLIALLIVLLSATTHAADRSQFSVGAGYLAIGPEIGAAVNIQSPYFLHQNRGALGIQCALLEAPQRKTYLLPQINFINRLMENEKISTYFKSALSLFSENELSKYGSIGINFSVGGNFDIGSDSLKLRTEVGYFLSFQDADKLDNKPYARGAGVSIGFAYYL